MPELTFEEWMAQQTRTDPLGGVLGEATVGDIRWVNGQEQVYSNYEGTAKWYSTGKYDPLHDQSKPPPATQPGYAWAWDAESTSWIPQPTSEAGKQVPQTYPLPTGQQPSYTDAQGNVKTWNPYTGSYETSGYTAPTAGTALGGMTPTEQANYTLQQQELAFRQQQANLQAQMDAAKTQAERDMFAQQLAMNQQQFAATYEMQRQQAMWQQQYQQQQLDQQKQQSLAELRANPQSWLQYSLEAGQTPAIQPWMLPLMPQEYGQLQAGGAIPGWQGLPQTNPAPAGGTTPAMNIPAYSPTTPTSSSSTTPFSPIPVTNPTASIMPTSGGGALPPTLPLGTTYPTPTGNQAAYINPEISPTQTAAMVDVNQQIIGGQTLSPADTTLAQQYLPGSYSWMQQQPVIAAQQAANDAEYQEIANPTPSTYDQAYANAFNSGINPGSLSQEDLIAQYGTPQPMATGGLVTEPTLALLGDGVDPATGQPVPEMVTPLTNTGWSGQVSSTPPPVGGSIGTPYIAPTSPIGWQGQTTSSTPPVGGSIGVPYMGTPTPTQPTQTALSPQDPRYTGMGGLPFMYTPSRQYQARMGPTAYGQYQGYEQMRTGVRPEELDWRLWSQAPPSGTNRGLTYRR